MTTFFYKCVRFVMDNGVTHLHEFLLSAHYTKPPCSSTTEGILSSQNTIVPFSGKLSIFVDPLAYFKFGENLEKVCKICDRNRMEFFEKIM